MIRWSSRRTKRVDYSEAGQLANEQTSDAATRGSKTFVKKKKFRRRLAKAPPKPQQQIVRTKAKELPIQAVRRKPASDRVALIIGDKRAKSGTGPISGKRRELLFIRIGDEKVLQAAMALKNGTALPRWALRFRPFLKERGGKLWWFEAGTVELPFALP